MKTKITLRLSASILLDALAILFIIYLGDISRFFAYPIYILDPMRMMVVLAITFTPRWNSWLLAIILPLVSYYLGAHPSIVKTSLMLGELLLNVWLFWFLFDKTRFALLSALLSIIFCKSAYYLLKYLCIKQGWLSGELISTPLDIQVITTISFAVFIFIMFLARGVPKRT